MAAAEPGVAANEPHEEPRFRFLARLAAVPTVAGVVHRASHCYGVAKARTSLFARALSTVENCATVMMRRCEPIVRTSLGRQLEYVDRIACQCLDTLQEHYMDALRRPEVIAADVAAFGCRKVAQLQRCARTKLDAAQDILAAAAEGVAAHIEAVAARLRWIMVSVHWLLIRVDHFLDWRIFLYSRHYPPHYNNISAELTLATRARIVLQKMRTVVKLYIRLKFSKFLWRQGAFLCSLQPSRSGWKRFQDPALAAVQHAYFLIMIVIGWTKRRYFYEHFYMHIHQFYYLFVTMREPRFDIYVTPDASSSEEDSPDIPVIRVY